MIDDVEAAQSYGRGLLVGELIRLRATSEDDLLVLERWWNDPEWQPLQKFAVRPKPTGAAADMIRGWSTNDAPTAAGFSVEDAATGDLVGHVTLFGAAMPERAATLAVMIGPESVGRGLGTDAVRTTVRYGFLALGLNRIELRVFAFNTRARRAYARAGFVEEGVRREVLFIDGGFADEVVMAILRREWDDA